MTKSCFVRAAVLMPLIGVLALVGCSSSGPDSEEQADNAPAESSTDAYTATCASGWYRVASCSGSTLNLWCYNPPTHTWHLKDQYFCGNWGLRCSLTGTDALGWPLSGWCK
jgi:hypothetical protein